MAKKHTLFILSVWIMLLIGVFPAACTVEPDGLEVQEIKLRPSPIVRESLAVVTVAAQASPTILVSSRPTATDITTDITAVPRPTISPPNVPAPTPFGANIWTLRVPILMYHYISVPPADADIYRTDLSVTPQNFREQMAYLAENGYTPIDLYQLSAAITAHIDLPEKPVILTFDDGYLDNYENAFPILQEFGFTGTFFVITDLADQGAEGYANWEQLEEMAAAGMRIETHTQNHPDLSTMSRDAVISQVLGSQETIAAHIGYTPRYLCYPGGTYNEETLQILEELDFWGATTTQGGEWHGFTNRYQWDRQRMRFDTTMDQFRIFMDLRGTAGGKKITGN